MSDYTIITIARQYGSGGLKVAKRLAEELGVNCYDNELFAAVSKRVAIPDGFAGADSKRENLINAAKHNYNGEVLPSESDDFDSMEKLFKYQSSIIEEIAEKESCVIVGRCANYILGDKPNVIRVFIYAPMDFKIKRKSLVHDEMSEKQLENHINRIDSHRASYYKYYTGCEWTDATNYDIVLDCSKMGIQNCIDTIKEFIAIKKKYHN